MALTVEDGTGLSTANAYISRSFADTYHRDRGNTAWTGGASDKEQAIIRATEWIDRTFDFQGARVNVGDPDASSIPPQALAWPREGVWHSDGIFVAEDAVPVEVQRATAEAALVALGVDLEPAATEPRVTRRDEQVGSVRLAEDFAGSGSEVVEIPKVAAILRPLLASGASFGSSTLNRT